MMAYRGYGGKAACILDIGMRWNEWSASHSGWLYHHTPRETGSGTHQTGGWECYICIILVTL